MNKYLPTEMRKDILKMAYAGNSNHIGCAFSIVEMISVLFEHYLDPMTGSTLSDPTNELVLSKGHGVMALYSALISKGVLPKSLISNYFKDGVAYAGLAECNIPGIKVSTGSLGHGICVATGIAFAKKRKGKSGKVFCIVGDGELNEGTVWESALFAAHQKLNNLVVLVDLNGWQAMGRTSDVLDLQSVVAKFLAFGFKVAECSGNDLEAVKGGLDQLSKDTEKKPSILVCKTAKGFGVSFMADNNQWHYLRMNEEHFSNAYRELDTNV